VVILEHANQPIIEATDLQDGHEGPTIAQPLTGELLEKGVDLLRLGRDLAGLQDIAAFIAECERQLSW